MPLRLPRPSPLSVGLLAVALFLAAIVGVKAVRRLDFGWIALVAALIREPGPVELLVEARIPVGRVRPIWDETNLWKLHALFGVERPDLTKPFGRDWLVRHFPWVRYARVTAVLGGNYAPPIAPWCDHGIAAPEHPDAGGECGHGGQPGPAAVNELAREIDGALVTDYGPFRTALERLLASGVRPHLNLSSAPTRFTDGAADFSHYHWNAAPVRDLDGWRRFVGGAFTAVADLDTSRWRVSIVNEPNCLTLVGWDRQLRHVGYAGTPDDYARTFGVTAAAVRAAAPDARVHAGNYVTSATFPGENNLAVYLAALNNALADDATVRGGDATVRWNDLAAVSLSLYETPETRVYDFVPVRVRRLYDAFAAAGLPPRPVKIDELEIHPAVSGPFDATERQRLDTTLYAASWHAEALRAFVAAGDVVSVAPWLDRMIAVPSLAPYPKAHVYGLFGTLAGDLRTVESDGGLGFARTGRRGGLRRVAVVGEAPPAADAPQPYRKRAESLMALATRSQEALRVLVVHHQNWPVVDRARTRRWLGRDVTIVARGVAPGAYVLRHLSLGGPDGAMWNGTSTTPLAWRADGCRTAQDGRLDLAPRRRLDANTVWLFEAARVPRCPNPSAPTTAEPSLAFPKTSSY